MISLFKGSTRWRHTQHLINVCIPTQVTCYTYPKVTGTVNSWYNSQLNARTHLMVGHRKSPRSRRNVMVIDPLTPSQGHQFHCRVKFFSVSWATVHPLEFDMLHDNAQKIKFLTPSKSQTLGLDPGDLMKIQSNMFYIFHLWEDTQSLV